MRFAKTFTIFLFLFLTIAGVEILAQRQDVIWARNVQPGSMVLDGQLNEAAWANAQEIHVTYGVPGLLPTSGYRAEFQAEAITDSTRATVKFLADGKYLYLGFNIPDSSIGGTQDWARWDGILMSVKDKAASGRPAPAVEYFYTYWLAGLANPTPVVGAKPRFIGRYGNFNDTTRTPEQIDAWDAVTVINGISNDSLPDVGMTIEMKIDVEILGYKIREAGGDNVAMNFSIWDADYVFGSNAFRTSATRTHLQSPWGNANANNVARVFIRPDVTINTATLPNVGPDVVVPNGSQFADPAIDGILSEAVWQGAYKFRIAWDDSLLRRTYPTAGDVSSGQWQPELNGNPRPPVLDGGNGTIHMFFKGDYLYLAADINDQLIQGTEVFDKFDGIGFIIGDPSSKNDDNVMNFRLLRAGYGGTGAAQAYDYLPTLVDSGGAQWAVALKPNSTVNINSDVDEGFNVEIKVDLKKLGYPAGLGDKLLFMGVALYDGDSFDDTLANYGERTWWFREHGGGPAVAWMMMDPNTPVSADEETAILMPGTVTLYGNYPNPFNPSTSIRFGLGSSGDAGVKIFNVLGQLVHSSVMNGLTAGSHTYNFNAANFASGVYYYQVEFKGSDNKTVSSQFGKMILMK
ncbi:MAG: T9SS type A sorting domain-containing protein [Ignavibacteriaceae bacterium]|nr:T9SS type A sorting domain-containing protein [Ignavibacteriaceae bacterium]